MNKMDKTMNDNLNDAILVDKFAEDYKILPLIALSHGSILPKQIKTFSLSRPLSINAAEYAFKNNIPAIIVYQKDNTIDFPTSDDIYLHGIKSTIQQIKEELDGVLTVQVEGICRVSAEDFTQHPDFIRVSSKLLITTGTEKTIKFKTLWRQLKYQYECYTALTNNIPPDLMAIEIGRLESIEDIEYAIDTIAINMPSVALHKIICQSQDLLERMKWLLRWLILTMPQNYMDFLKDGDL